jgi:hypothetical protein
MERRRATVDAGAFDLTVSGSTSRRSAAIVETICQALASLTERPAGSQLPSRFLVTSARRRSRTRLGSCGVDEASRPRACGGARQALSRQAVAPAADPPPTGNGDTRYELFHDVLAEPIAEWRAGYEQEQRRRATVRRFARVGGVLLLLVGVFATLGIWALVQRNEARSATRSATSLALARRQGNGRRPRRAVASPRARGVAG